MNILDLIIEAAKAAESYCAGKTDAEIREGVERAAHDSYIAYLKTCREVLTNDEDYQHWRGYFAVACFR